MSSLLKDAIADAKQLRETAEQNAKNAIITAVTPRIRALIEQQLLGEGMTEDIDDDDSANILLDVEGDEAPVPTIPTTSPPAPAAGTTAATAGTAANISLPDGSGKITVDLDSLKVDGQNQAQIGMGGGQSPSAPGGAPSAGTGTMDVVLDDDAQAALGGLGETVRSAITTKIFESEVDLRALRQSSKKLGAPGTLVRANQIKSIIESTYKHAQANRSSMDAQTVVHLEEKMESLYADVATLIGESRVADLNGRVKRLESRVSACRDISKARLTPGAKARFGTFLKEIRDEVSAASYIIEDRSTVLDVHLKEIFRAGRKILDMYKETKEMSMRNGTLLNEEDIMLRLTLPEDSELEAADLGVEVIDDEDGDADADDFGGEGMDDDLGGDEGGEDFDLGDFGDEGLEGGEEEEPVDEMVEGQHDNDKGPGDDALDENEVVEIDEAMLRSEILRMQRLAEARKKAKKGDKKDEKKDAKKKGVKEGVKVGKPESTGTSGPGSFEDFGGGSDEGHPFINNTYSEIQKESRRNRTLLRKLAEYRAAFERAREKLAETNLFNAKLLYANKLLQNTNITPRMRESAIDSLDAAKSLREVKLVYSSLIGASRSGKGGLTESAGRPRGSGSRPARSGGATLNEAAEVKRWATLAGITDDKDVA